MGERYVVDGETFDVSRRGRATVDLDWVSGPNADYGFSITAGPSPTLTRQDLEQAIREFLADIDPETGYLSEQ